jgi:ketosteroid isomerase-like protein
MTNASHPNRVLIERFYTAFGKRDSAEMARCYHPQVRFDDPAFTDLDFNGVTSMWRMLCERGKDLRIELPELSSSGDGATWVAYYTFSQTGRSVINRINARFEFKDGLIVRHIDHFNFHLWARQALGFPGLLLGWTPFFKNKVKAGAMKNLTTFMARN